MGKSDKSFASLSKAGKEVSGPSLSSAQIRARAEFSEADYDFAVAMFAQLRDQPGNLFFSPFSIRTVLSTTYAGARGATAEQMQAALRLPDSQETVHKTFGEIIHRLNAAGDGKYEVAISNSIWAQDGAPLLSNFLDVIARDYGCGMKLVDSSRDAEAVSQAINQWVETETRNKIRGLIHAESLDPEMRLALVNAVYFKGRWALPFEEEETSDEWFYLDNGMKVRAPLMYQQNRIRYLQAEGYQAVDLCYGDSDLSMLILLPEREDGLRNLEMSLSAQMLHDCIARVWEQKIELYLPRFKIDPEAVNLSDPLHTLGITLAFDRSQADLSGINGRRPPDKESLYISALFHKAFAEVNEKGTEAAAASGLMLFGAALYGSEPPPVPTFRADHPFLFAIRDHRSKAILFLGRIADPTDEN